MKQPSRWLVFSLVAIAQFMVVLDVSITNVALPTIKQALHFSSNSSLQWVITAYALTFGGFLLLGGRAADLYGRRRTLLIGMSGFTFFSLLIGFSHTETMLIALRALQGLAAALMSPSALSIVLTTFSEGRERNKALGLWATAAPAGAATGLLLGGVLTQYLGWEWNFFINVPVGIIVAIAISRIVPVHEKEEKDSTLDLPGAVLVTGGLISLVYAISQAPIKGWLSAHTLGIIGFGLVLIVAFIVNESRAKHPLVPLSIFKIRNVIGGNLIMAPVAATMFGNFFLLSLYTQNVLRYSPVLTGISFLPFPIVTALTSTNIPKFVSKYGYKRFLIAGPIFIGIALLWLSKAPADGQYLVNLLPPMLIMPFGIGMTFMPVIAAATSGVPGREAGLASGLINTSQQMGGALGLSILSGIDASVATAAGGSPLQAQVHGYSRAFAAAAIFQLFALILAVMVIKQRKPADSNS
ncbi:MAG TPA: MFS transporter [Candidatus Saccharimonadales bacterium]|nr:MFS transporter [Candidatus Saccharimonadales bacterium]